MVRGSWPLSRRPKGRHGAGRRGLHLFPHPPNLSLTLHTCLHHICCSSAVPVTRWPVKVLAPAMSIFPGFSGHCCCLGTTSHLYSKVHAHLAQAGAYRPGGGAQGWEGPRQADVPPSAQAPPRGTTSSGSGQPARAWSRRRGTHPTWTSFSTLPAQALPWPSRPPAPFWPAPPARPPLSAGIFQ